MQTRIHRIIFFGIVLLLIFAPLAFGSVHVWAYSMIEVGIFLLLLLWFADRLIFSKSKTLSWVKTPVNLILLILFLVIGLQLIPLPPSVVALISPHTYADKKQLFTILAKAADASADGPSWMVLSYSLHPTLVEWLKLGAYFGMFFLVLNTLKSKKDIDILVYTLILIGLFQAIYAIFQIFNITPRVWWWKSRFGSGSRFASGTFIGSNHFAGYMEMVLCLTFGFLIAQKKQTRRMLSGLGGTRALLQKFVSWFAPESARPKMIFFFFVAIIIGVALLLSASRGGILSLGTSMFFMAVLFLLKNRYRKYSGLPLFLCLAALTYGLHIGIEPTLNKFENPTSLYSRLHITRTIIPMVGDYPALGVGLGNFRYVYPRYIDDYDRVSSSGYAHNDWVEAGTENGFFGFFLIFLAFVIYIVRMTRIWHRRRYLHALGIGAGVMAGLLSISMHSYFEFNMHIPANPLTLAALLAIGYAVVHRQGHGYNESFFYSQREIPLTRFRRFTIFGLVLFFSGFAIFSVGKHLLAEAACPTEWNSTMNLSWNPELSDIKKAIALNTCNFEYHYKRAGHFMSLDAENTKNKKAFNLEAKRGLEQAVRLNPASGVLWYNLGKIYSLNKYDLFDYLNKWLPLADECFDAGIKCAPMDEHLLFNVAGYWVWRARLLPERKEEGKKIRRLEDKRTEVSLRPIGAYAPVGGQLSSIGDKGDKSKIFFREDGIRKFQDLFQQSLDINPLRWKKAVDRVWKYFPDDAVVIGIVPENNKELKSHVLKFLAKIESSEPVKGAGETELKSHVSKFLPKTESSEPVKATGETAKKRYHTVSSGNTLYSIGRRYGLTVEKIRLLNNLDEGAVIHPGQRLLVRISNER